MKWPRAFLTLRCQIYAEVGSGPLFLWCLRTRRFPLFPSLPFSSLFLVSPWYTSQMNISFYFSFLMFLWVVYPLYCSVKTTNWYLTLCLPASCFLFVFFATFWKSKLAPLSARMAQGHHCIIVTFQCVYYPSSPTQQPSRTAPRVSIWPRWHNMAWS